MAKSIDRKHKRQFYGNKFTNTSKKNSTSAVPEYTASCSKLGKESFSTAEEMPGPVFGNRIVELEFIVEAFAQLCCLKCFAEKVELFEDSRYGLCSHFTLKCKGFAGAFKLCSTLNLTRLTKTAYKNQEAKLLKVVQKVAEESMIKAATEIEEKQQKNLSSDIVKCGISVDGTWQRRGYTSMNGCVAAISVDTADHICQCNFTGSSSKMEIVGASRIFLRSEKIRRLQYTQYYGDGDSKAFMSVKDTCGLNSVTKFECIDHVQKRVGSRLRKLKTKTKGLSGKGKLTDNFIDRLQNYYGIAVRSNVGNLTALQQNVIAALYHCASSDKKPMHGQCPIGKESWCYFQRGVVNGTKCSTKYAGLSNDVLNKIKPVYLELCDKQVLSKCLHGRTQNANECFNGIVWQKVPKEVFVSLKTIKFGSYDAVIHFNEGLNGCLKVFNKMNIKNPGVFTLRGYKHLDKCRIR
ncbi:uncharacterized protein TNCV_482021 [Trichonephila clavipes]|uniref:Mutator-like transposase domain-containing protein n=1 Tax=Trichonephila clavipes TaxID=2585209 RepID=A0A8X6S3G8_TRICX|nr:uncharacterized protein TNCV_482021 [Trichonephila clavipes]